MSIWHSDQLDLDAYLARVGLPSNPDPTLATLRALHRAQTLSIPFENLAIMLGRPVVLDLESLQDKMVRRPRGGYCYEHVTLLAAVLERLGYRFTALTARVSLGAASIRPATHALIVVEIDGHRWLCDVGFGCGPLEPIELVADVDVDQEGWGLRLTRAPLGGSGEVFHPDEWTLWHRPTVDGDHTWQDRHKFTLTPQYTVDYAVGCHYVSTYARSPFTTRPYVQRFSADEQHTLDGTVWTTIAPDRVAVRRDIEINDVPALLVDVFSIELTADEASGLVEWMHSHG